ncbi:MAG: phosphoglycerate dehydrogenase [Gammaproteobacteria bacterium]|nr:phosphoglycerate dehydrogenase [Gammaproteobacteria bacterium]
MSTLGRRYVVGVADKVSPSGLGALTGDGRFEVRWLAEHPPAEKEEAMTGVDAIIVRSATRITRELIESASNLKVIGRAGAGVDNIDLDAATERGIPVLNAPAGNTVSAAELTFALILALARKVVAADRSVREMTWKTPGLAGVELNGKSLGLVGAGRIGGEVARRARAFGMKVLVYDPYLPATRAEELDAEPSGLDHVIEQADFLSLHVPLTPSTTSMIGAKQLRRMKPSACLVNAARGGVVDEDALARALGEGWLAGAALDVFRQEPLSASSPLLESPNLILSPHLGASTAEAQELVASEIASAVRGALLDGDLSRAVNAPGIDGATLRKLRPLLELGTRIGRLACALASGGIRGVQVRYSGASEEATGPLTAAVLCGLLEDIVGGTRVNAVNAARLAEARGMRVVAASATRHPDYSEYLVTELEAEGGRLRVAGALLEGTHPRIVGIGGFSIDLEPRGSIVIVRNQDKPGVIAGVGTVLASMGFNIAGYHQARLEPGGDAMAAVTVDGEITQELLDRLRELDQISYVKSARLG